MADEPGKTATLHTPGGELEMTIRPATEGASAFEIGKLLSGTGLTTYDPGYGNTAPVSSAITYIDGDAGSCATAVTRSTSSRRSRHSWRPATC
jgi:citrate synthase